MCMRPRAYVHACAQAWVRVRVGVLVRACACACACTCVRVCVCVCVCVRARVQCDKPRCNKTKRRRSRDPGASSAPGESLPVSGRERGGRVRGREGGRERGRERGREGEQIARERQREFRGIVAGERGALGSAGAGQAPESGSGRFPGKRPLVDGRCCAIVAEACQAGKRHRGSACRVDRRTRHRPGAQRGGHGASTRIAAGRLGWRGRPATILAAVPTPSATQGRWLGLCLKLERGPGRRLALSPAGPPGWHLDRPRVSAPRWQLPASQVRPLRHTQGRRWSQVESPAGWPALEQMPGR